MGNDNLSAIEFHDVLGEPDAIHSMDCVWKNSYCCFNCTLSCCYKVLTVLCGIPLAFCWACEFACLSCSHIWYYTPALRICEIECGIYKKFLDFCLKRHAVSPSPGLLQDMVCLHLFDAVVRLQCLLQLGIVR